MTRAKKMIVLVLCVVLTLIPVAYLIHSYINAVRVAELYTKGADIGDDSVERIAARLCFYGKDKKLTWMVSYDFEKADGIAPSRYFISLTGEVLHIPDVFKNRFEVKPFNTAQPSLPTIIPNKAD